jgi:hypothetical protein
MADETDTFLSRWSRRKAAARVGTAEPVDAALDVAVEAAPLAQAAQAVQPGLQPAAPVAPVVDLTGAEPGPRLPAAPQAPPPPTMADVALLTRDADYTRFLGTTVSSEVRNGALKHLFTDPHFNVMDGLDIYIGDYNTPDPLPPGMLRQMVQSHLLGLFDDEVDADGQAQPAPPTSTADPTPLSPDENPDLQLQPDDDAGRPGPEPGAVAHAGRPD